MNDEEFANFIARQDKLAEAVKKSIGWCEWPHMKNARNSMSFDRDTICSKRKAAGVVITGPVTFFFTHIDSKARFTVPNCFFENMVLVQHDALYVQRIS